MAGQEERRMTSLHLLPLRTLAGEYESAQKPAPGRSGEGEASPKADTSRGLENWWKTEKAPLSEGLFPACVQER